MIQWFEKLHHEVTGSHSEPEVAPREIINTFEAHSCARFLAGLGLLKVLIVSHVGYDNLIRSLFLESAY